MGSDLQNCNFLTEFRGHGAEAEGTRSRAYDNRCESCKIAGSTPIFQEYTDYAKKRVSELTNKGRIDTKALDADVPLAEKSAKALRLGGYADMNAATIDKDRRAEKVMVPVIQERLGSKMPKGVQRAIEKLNKP